NGVVVALKATVDQYASAHKPVLTVVDDDRWCLIADFGETDLNNVGAGVAAGDGFFPPPAVTKITPPPISEAPRARHVDPLNKNQL
ncbi:hypothetical protein NL496_28670, partial [Klebsiella pneumoniae]|nr:hypothetical protein [Klebsiella pneumoniae]